MSTKACVLVLFLLLSPLATADTIEINFSGTINLSNGPDPALENITLGEFYSGQLVYTLPAADTFSESGSTNASYYIFPSLTDGLTVWIGGYTFSSVGAPTNSANSAQVDQTNGYPLYGGSSFFFGGAISSTTLHGGISLSLVGSPGFILSSGLPPQLNLVDLIQPSPGTNPSGTFMELNFSEDGSPIGTEVRGTVDSIQIADSVPEPSTMGLTALVLIFAAFTAWRLHGRIGFMI